MKKTVLKSIYNILGSICIGNGCWMLASASNWFHTLPIYATDNGPLNTHFVHDLGLVFTLAGIGALWCGYKLKDCIEVHLGITFFISGHALIHIFEILSGALPQSHWLIDFPLITFPAILLLSITPILLKNNLLHENV